MIQLVLLEQLQETLHIFLNKKRYFYKKYAPTTSSSGCPNIVIFYFGFETKIENENGSLECI
jgi:hypothetical protein